MRLLASALAVLSLSGEATAPTDVKPPDPPALLRESAPVTLSALPQGMFSLPHLCDSDGNVYVAPSSTKDDGDPKSVVRVSADGRKTLSISLSSVPDLPVNDDVRVMAMSLDADDELRVLIKGRQSPLYALTFGRDGKYKSKVKVDVGPVAIRLLGAFPTGELLVAGAELGDQAPRPMFGVLSSGGDLLQPAYVSEEHPDKKPLAGGRKAVVATSFLEDVQTDRDGHVYVAQHGPAGPILKVSRFGEVLSRFEVEPPERDARLTRFKIAGRRLVVEHEGSRGTRKTPARWFTVYDLTTEEKLERYTTETGGLLCYRSVSGLPDSFALLTSDGKSLQLVQATGR